MKTTWATRKAMTPFSVPLRVHFTCRLVQYMTPSQPSDRLEVLSSNLKHPLTMCFFELISNTSINVLGKQRDLLELRPLIVLKKSTLEILHQNMHININLLWPKNTCKVDMKMFSEVWTFTSSEHLKWEMTVFRKIEEQRHWSREDRLHLQNVSSDILSSIHKCAEELHYILLLWCACAEAAFLHVQTVVFSKKYGLKYSYIKIRTCIWVVYTTVHILYIINVFFLNTKVSFALGQT